MSVLLVENKHCDVTVVLKDGSEIDIFSDQLFNNDLHHWQGWICNAGYDGIYIESDFNVYSAVCYNDNLGNLFDDNFSLLKTPTVCRQEKCTSCSYDLGMSKKKEVNNVSRTSK
jgi:MoaA/NifB/PqqE/SkfB family radical SAM enzyme